MREAWNEATELDAAALNLKIPQIELFYTTLILP